MADDDESGSAANFLADTPDDRAGLTAHVQASEAAFEARAVRALLTRFAVDPKGWDVKEAMGGDRRYRFGVFDAVYPRFPVRLGASRAVATSLAAKTRRTGNLGFHEVTPAVLFKPDEFRKLRVWKEWTALRDDQSLDLRNVGLVFGVVNALFVIHDWYISYPRPSLALVWRRGDDSDDVVTVEPFAQFLDRVEYHGWMP